MKDRATKWREELYDKSQDDLDDELTRPTGVWNEDVLREAIRRILKMLEEATKK